MSDPTSRSGEPPGRRPGERPQPDEAASRSLVDRATGRQVVGLRLPSQEIRVDPGALGAVDITVGNYGNVVDEISLQVEGPAGAWAEITPARVALMPGTTANAVVTFRPPRTAVLRAGPIEFAIHAASREVPEAVAIQAGVVRVGAFSDAAAQLTPGTVRSSGRARLRFTVMNQGNIPIGGAVQASDPDDELDLAVAPRRIDVGPGGSAVALVTARPRKRTWFGDSQNRLVRVEFSPDHAAPIAASSSLIQLPILGKRPPIAMAALGVLAVAAVLIATVALRPQADSPGSLQPTPTQSPIASVPALVITQSPDTPGPPPTERPADQPLPATPEPIITPAPPDPPDPPNALFADQLLNLGGLLVSPNREWTLVLQESDGNLVTYSSGGDGLWASSTSGCGVQAGVMQGDGNFVLYAEGDGHAIWATGSEDYPPIAGSWIELHDDGQLVLVSPSGQWLWVSTDHPDVPEGFDPCLPHP